MNGKEFLAEFYKEYDQILPFSDSITEKISSNDMVLLRERLYTFDIRLAKEVASELHKEVSFVDHYDAIVQL